MAFKIGFCAEHSGGKTDTPVKEKPEAPRKSLVQVYFPCRKIACTYYNDRFDLKCGDTVYVDGKLEGKRGRVTEVSYNFKIRLSDYKRVIAVADTAVSGRLYMAETCLVAFDSRVLPREKIAAWFMAPSVDDEFASGSDGTAFPLDNLAEMKLDPAIAMRGHDYYTDNRVKYICLDGNRGYAIVAGSDYYEVEFEYRGGEISSLTCSCYCSGGCKHEFAAMILLKELLKLIEERWAEEYGNSGYFAAIGKDVFFEFAVCGRQEGSFTFTQE